jgi:hypothetical protein
MAILVDYIWQTTFILLFLYGIHWVLLSKEKALTATRVYFIASPIIAFVCPLISIPVEFDKPGISLNQTEFFRALSEQGAPEFFVATYGLPEVTVEDSRLPILLEIQDILLLAYASVAILLLIRLVWGWMQIRMLQDRGWSQSTYDLKNKCLVIPTFGKSPVFSFFDRLFWDNTASLDIHEKNLIYAHELVHIRQRHSWDVVYFQVLSIIFWFNPIIHLMRHTITELHEYLADREIVEKNTRPDDYIRLIASQAIRGIEFSVGSHFAKSLTLSRIQMIKKSGKKNILKLFAVFPLTIFLIALVSLRSPENVHQRPDKLTSSIDLVKQKLLSSKDSLTVGIKMNRISDPDHFEYIGELRGQKIVAQIGVFEYVFDGIRNEKEYRKVRKLIENLRENSLMPSDYKLVGYDGPVDRASYFPGPAGAWEEIVLEKIALPDRELKMGLEGVIEIEFFVDKEGRVVDPVIKRSIGGGIDAQFLQVLQNHDLPRWKPAVYQNRPVRSRQTVSFGIYTGAQ